MYSIERVPSMTNTTSEMEFLKTPPSVAAAAISE